MSRIGNRILEVPAGVTIDIDNSNIVTVKGPKGELKQQVDPDMTIKLEDGNLTVSRPTEQKRHKSMHGLYNALIANMLEGVTAGFKRELELVGVGYRASNKGQLLELALGYSHPIYFMVPEEVVLSTSNEKGSNPMVILESYDKQLVGQVAAKIKAFRKPEPFKGKGIRFKGEWIRRKAGKTAAK